MEERNCRFLSGAGESVHTSSSGLQPRAKRKRPPSEVLPPARWPFPSASAVLEGLGCEGNVLASVRRRKVGPFRCRVHLPGGVRRVEAARPWWNKVFRSSLCLVFTYSGDDDGVMRLEFAESGDRVGAPDLDVSCTGVLCCTLLAAARRRRMADGSVDGWWRGWCLVILPCRRRVLALDRRSLGCVPGRCASSVRFLCGSCQSLWAMKLLSVLVCLSFVPGSEGLGVCGGAPWRWTASLGSTKVPMGFIVIFMFSRDFCVRWYGHLSLLYTSRRCLYLCWTCSLV